MGGVAWTEEEDQLLIRCIELYGEGKWHRIPLLSGLNRCRKSCRLRWLNYLRPDIKRGRFKEEEVQLIIELHKLLGNKWSSIAARLAGRTANDVKNLWNCHLSKRLSAEDRVVVGMNMNVNEHNKLIIENNAEVVDQQKEEEIKNGGEDYGGSVDVLCRMKNFEYYEDMMIRETSQWNKLDWDDFIMEMDL